jgi:hypothetical protein
MNLRPEQIDPAVTPFAGSTETALHAARGRPDKEQRPRQESEGAANEIAGGDNAKFTAPITPLLLAQCAVFNRRLGFRDTLQAFSEDGQAMAAAAAPFLRSHPRYAELVDQRQHVPTTRCSAPACRSRCSRCVRATAVASNRARYGSDDFPGAA